MITDGCVGCGRCVELCPQNPTAIDIRRRCRKPTPPTRSIGAIR
ncbi:MAG: hypothetical protein GY910_07620 [bacterium]|nr:hypothetical protein [bacterium]